MKIIFYFIASIVFSVVNSMANQWEYVYKDVMPYNGLNNNQYGNNIVGFNISNTNSKYPYYNETNGNLLLQNNVSTIDSYESEYIYEKDKKTYLLTSFGGTLGFMVIGAGVLYLMPQSVTNWNREDINNLGSNWLEHVKKPVFDKDDWVLNYVMHPYFGAIYYMQAREAGYEYWQSFLYSAAMSTFFWEFGIEAFAEYPSIQDLIVTPVIGSLVGELFYQASYSIKKNDAKVWDSKILGYTLLTLMDPGFLLIQRTSLKNFTAKKNHKSGTPLANDDAYKSYSSWHVSNNGLMLSIRMPL